VAIVHYSIVQSGFRFVLLDSLNRYVLEPYLLIVSHALHLATSCLLIVAWLVYGVVLQRVGRRHYTAPVVRYVV
jgi:hypothetical protein